MLQTKREFKRGDIWLADLPETKSSIQYGKGRPVILVNNDKANHFSPVIHVVILTSKPKKMLPTQVRVGVECGLIRDSIACCEQTILLPKEALTKKVGRCNTYVMSKINASLAIQFDLAI